jgi:transcriptional regulator with XRE-family HTH domain
MFREEFNPGVIQSQTYRAAVQRALDYRTRIEAMIRQSEAGVLQAHLQESTAGISDWIAQIFRLAQRLDVFERDSFIKQDVESAPREIVDLSARVQREADTAVREQAQRTLESKKAQWQNLKKLKQTMEQAELQLDATLTALGTVYSQLMLIHSKDDIEDSRSQRLREDIAEQVAKLNELQGAMDEVYQGKSEK